MTNERPNRKHPKPFERVNPKKTVISLNAQEPSLYGGEQLPVGGGEVSEQPHFDYDYYDENDEQFLGKIRAQVSGGGVEKVEEDSQR